MHSLDELLSNPSLALVAAPASLSNLGPGFDALGLAIEGLGDIVEVWASPEPGVRMVSSESGATWVAPDDRQNTAVVAAESVLRTLGRAEGLILRIRKGVTPGSGLGSSAASAVAGAWAANVACGEPLTKAELVDAVLEGESMASGSRHGDNVLPALFGGLVLVSSSDPHRYKTLSLGAPLHMALIFPDVRVLTREARAMLPAQVPLRDAVSNAAEFAFLLHALQAGDVEAAGRCIMQDRLVEPVRATLVPCYETVRQTALEAGAFGCALSGSGPAMFALCASHTDAERVAKAMRSASEAMGIAARSHAVRADNQGAVTLAEAL